MGKLNAFGTTTTFIGYTLVPKFSALIVTESSTKLMGVFINEARLPIDLGFGVNTTLLFHFQIHSHNPLE